MLAKEHAQKILEQLNAVSDGIEWVLLCFDEADGRGMVIARDCVTQRAYHEPTVVTWETSNLRKWLNTEFYDSLPLEIRSRVVEVENENKDSCAIPGGNNTIDKVFVLSIDEYSRYLPEALRVARFHGEPCWWWLRSPGYSTGDVADVYPDGGLDGGIDAHGFYAFADCGGVRPAMYLDLSQQI